MRVTVKMTFRSAFFEKGSIRTVGKVEVNSFIHGESTVDASFQPDGVKVFRYEQRFVFVVKIIPVVITVRPALDALMQMDGSIEGRVFLASAVGYDYDILIDYDHTRSAGNRFSSSHTITERDTPVPDPEFTGRASLGLELAARFWVDVVLYELVQGMVGVDAGFRGGMTIGMDLDSLFVTRPFPYKIENFEVNQFSRVWVGLGLNRSIGDFVSVLVSLLLGTSGECQASVTEVLSFDYPELSEFPDPADDLIENLLNGL